jgi:hypothetical protein
MTTQVRRRTISVSTSNREAGPIWEVRRNMNKYERRQQFEVLCQLRALYRLRGDWDATSTISIDEVVAYAVRLLEEPDTLAVALGIDGSNDAAAPNPDPKR